MFPFSFSTLSTKSTALITRITSSKNMTPNFIMQTLLDFQLLWITILMLVKSSNSKIENWNPFSLNIKNEIETALASIGKNDYHATLAFVREIPPTLRMVNTMLDHFANENENEIN